MIKMICDECGSDCDLCAYDVQIGSLHNPVPVRLTDTGDAQITCDKETIRYVLCQRCYAKHKLPNIWMTLNSKQLEFSDEDYSDDVKHNKPYQDLAYQVRTHLTSITRYVFNKKDDKSDEYKKLAEDAVNALLLYVNGKSNHQT